MADGTTDAVGDGQPYAFTYAFLHRRMPYCYTFCVSYANRIADADYIDYTYSKHIANAVTYMHRDMSDGNAYLVAHADAYVHRFVRMAED